MKGPSETESKRARLNRCPAGWPYIYMQSPQQLATIRRRGTERDAQSLVVYSAQSWVELAGGLKNQRHSMADSDSKLAKMGQVLAVEGFLTAEQGPCFREEIVRVWDREEDYGLPRSRFSRLAVFPWISLVADTRERSALTVKDLASPPNVASGRHQLDIPSHEPDVAPTVLTPVQCEFI
jgi:hypothetical protein